MTATVRTTGDLAPLDPCRSITRARSRPVVHVRHPRAERLTLCGRTIGHDLQPEVTAAVGCGDCRVTRTMIRDRADRGLPELCLEFTRPWGPRRAYQQTRCMQVVEGHRTRPDLDYPCPWHDGQELPWREEDDE